MSDANDKVVTQEVDRHVGAVDVQTKEVARPLTALPGRSLPPSAPREMVDEAVKTAHRESPATGFVEQQVVVKEVEK